MRMKMMTRCL